MSAQILHPAGVGGWRSGKSSSDCPFSGIQLQWQITKAPSGEELGAYIVALTDPSVRGPVPTSWDGK